jgi:opacity protein-like surface antigen
MIRTAFVLGVLVGAGCVSTSGRMPPPALRASLVPAAAPALRLLAAAAAEVPPGGADNAANEANAANSANPTNPAPAAPLPKGLFGGGFTRARLGAFVPTGDLDTLDDGVFGEVGFGTGLLPLLSAEVSLGYLQADNAAGAELTAVPLFVNARVDVPILVFGIYAGVGVGGLLADYEVLGVDDSEFLVASRAFAGLEFGLGNLAVGAEYQYLASDETDAGFTIEGHAGLVTLTIPF